MGAAGVWGQREHRGSGSVGAAECGIVETAGAWGLQKHGGCGSDRQEEMGYNIKGLK